MKKIISVVVCACILASALCLTSFADNMHKTGEACWEGLGYGEFAEQGRRSAKSTGDEFTGRIMLKFGSNVPYEKTVSINDFPGLEIAKIENLVNIFNGACNYSFITLKDKSYESVINALEYLENYTYTDKTTVRYSFHHRDANGYLGVITDEENEASFDAVYAYREKFGDNWITAYEGLFDSVQAEFKHGENLLDKFDYRMGIGDSKTTYKYQVIAETNTENGIVRSEYFNGDADGNTLVNTKDAIRILKYVANWEGVDVELGADVDLDGLVNVKDCVQVLKMIIDSMEADPVPVR